MGIQDINNAAAAQNALTARINNFLDTIDADIATRQAAYNALSADLIGIVTDRMRVQIAYSPNEAEADLSDGGHFRDWGELLTFANSLPVGCHMLILLPEGETLVMTQIYYEHLYGHRHFDFKATPNNPAVRPKIRVGCYDKVNYNQYYYLNPGNGGSVSLTYVDVEFDTTFNPGIGFSTGKQMFSWNTKQRYSVDLYYCNVTGFDGVDLGMVSAGGHAELSLRSVTIDGNMYALDRYGAYGTGILTADAVTLTNGAVLYDTGFTVGQNLLTN